jgi:NADPH:quinone reductase-like Zn-dependent oxidoreductase
LEVQAPLGTIEFMSRGVRNKAKALGVRYAFLFMRAQGQQLSQITSLIESGIIRTVVDKVYPFEKTPDALAYVENKTREGQGISNEKRACGN